MKIITKKEAEELGWLFLTTGNTMTASKKGETIQPVKTFIGCLLTLRKKITKFETQISC